VMGPRWFVIAGKHLIITPITPIILYFNSNISELKYLTRDYSIIIMIISFFSQVALTLNYVHAYRHPVGPDSSSDVWLKSK
jgi:hypothetical protein